MLMLRLRRLFFECHSHNYPISDIADQQMTSEKSGKVQSLQGLRGIAILLVLLFHLSPTTLTNGFVGVDMFFVLSGYLMTRILSKSLSFESVVDFYKKRFNRIVSLYYLTILGTIMGVLCLVLQSERNDFIDDVFWSLPLISNMKPIFEHHTYWEQVSSIRYLTHLWSLCTELQYYLLAPPIHFIASNLSFPNRILAYFTAILILFCFQLLTPPEYSYAFLASRVWQFLLGSVACEFSKKSSSLLDSLENAKEKKKKRPSLFDVFPFLFLALLIVILTLPSVFGENLTRLLMSLSSALLCFFCGRLDHSFLTLRPLVFFGDISYVTYLVHWPVINFIRYVQQRDHSSLTLLEALVAVTIILVLSVVLHFFLERRLLQHGFLFNFSLSCLVIGLSYSLLPFLRSSQCLALNTLPEHLQVSAQFNLDSSNLFINISQLPCDFTETNANLTVDLFGIEYCSHRGTGNGTVLVIGNSLSIRAFPVLFQLFDGRYEELRLFAKHGGAPLLNIAEFYTEAALQMEREMKPDLVWIIQGMNELLFATKNPRIAIGSDALDVVVAEKLKDFEELTKAVEVDLPFFLTEDYPAKLIARSLIYRNNIAEKLSVSLEDVEKQLGEQTERLLNSNCTKCHFNDIQKALNGDRKRFYMYEESTYKAFSYDGSHLSLAAYEHIKPIYLERINNFLRSLFP